MKVIRTKFVSCIYYFQSHNGTSTIIMKKKPTYIWICLVIYTSWLSAFLSERLWVSSPMISDFSHHRPVWEDSTCVFNQGTLTFTFPCFNWAFIFHSTFIWRLTFLGIPLQLPCYLQTKPCAKAKRRTLQIKNFNSGDVIRRQRRYQFL